MRQFRYKNSDCGHVERYAVVSAIFLLAFAVLTVGTVTDPTLSFISSEQLLCSVDTVSSSGALSSFGKVFSPYSLPSVFFVRGNKEDVVSSDKSPSGFYDDSHLEYLEKAEAAFAMAEIPDGALPVVKTVLNPAQGFEKIGEIYINNESGKDIECVPVPIKLVKELKEPQVLIYHTHGTEAYNPGYSFYGNDVYSPNSTDISENVVRIGSVIAQVLENNGVEVIHLTEMFDASGYSDAYDRSCSAVEKILEENPSISIVLDIHRDTVIDSEGTKLRPVVQTEKGAAAQLMILLGSGKKGAQVPLWNENLSFALALCSEINEIDGDILRPIMLRATRYNQHLSTGAILVEVGTCGNTLSEAERAALIFADALISSCFD